MSNRGKTSCTYKTDQGTSRRWTIIMLAMVFCLGSNLALADDEDQSRITEQKRAALIAAGEAEPSAATESGQRQASGSVIDIAVSRAGGTGSTHYMEYGISGDIAAFSSRTTACNVGSQVADWMYNGNSGGSTNRHPLISQHLYRFSADQMRFEMIGMSWLKHSFCALSETTCGSCQSTNCSTLGIGCADTYTASRNGSTNLGPRRDANPVGTLFNGQGVGTHQHPFSGPTGSSTIRGRLQARVDDLPTANPGADYFVVIQYVTHDEPLVNRYNNSTWVKVNMPGFPYTGSMTNNGSWHMFESAIDAWKALDSDVTIGWVDDIQRGRFILGHKVTNNLDGTWHYEYALHNYNSHLSASSFQIPIPPNVVVTNVEFHDVFYHSGDSHPSFPSTTSFDGTDWTAEDSDAGGPRLLSWTGPTYDENLNGNALRWGTTFNFRYDANSPPQENQQITISHYRGSTDGPGLPDEFTMRTSIPQSVAACSKSCPTDVDGDSNTGPFDLASMLACWGPVVPGPCECLDVDSDGDLGPADLAGLLGSWGPCP